MTISELEELSGVPRRTIHYYIQRDLLPPAVGSGPTASYTPEHLIRLRLISLWKDSNLKLRGIRNILDSMTWEDMKTIAGELLEEEREERRPRANRRSNSRSEPTRKPGREPPASPGVDLEDSTTWRRVRVTEGLELSYRPGEGSRFVSKLKELIRSAQTIFADEIRKERRS